MLRKLAGYPRQNPIARALREVGRVERTLFMLDWFDDPEQRRWAVAGALLLSFLIGFSRPIRSPT